MPKEKKREAKQLMNQTIQNCFWLQNSQNYRPYSF